MWWTDVNIKDLSSREQEEEEEATEEEVVRDVAENDLFDSEFPSLQLEIATPFNANGH